MRFAKFTRSKGRVIKRWVVHGSCKGVAEGDKKHEGYDADTRSENELHRLTGCKMLH